MRFVVPTDEFGVGAKSNLRWVACPVPRCKQRIGVADWTAEGEHDCPCMAQRLRLSWASYLDRGRVPALTVVEDGKP